MSDAVTSNAFRQRIAKHMANSSPLPPIAYMVFGSGGHDAQNKAKPANPDATGLTKQLLKKPLAVITQEDGFSVTGRGVIEENELVGAVISEAALLDADNQIIGIKTFAPKFKEGRERYEIEIKLRF